MLYNISLYSRVTTDEIRIWLKKFNIFAKNTILCKLWVVVAIQTAHRREKRYIVNSTSGEF